ncbi:hypothetical protein P152DRAFT_401695 [Eremomyces bilateralis CBS 781.70]|uniref:Protease propeptide/inhibitor n=1 Tax=Eremomyces bilateralis CBS 781.70 TaxID=1392243 RepID=A0A6G1FXB0_9PEZI|nr:uncharacterized protein P152DRAFT_401695 [Eremomyces bilateralis CBS 781.70]KAF1810306.1 hypothetical protein P152DRAFT_401695 [Eremomyces bilateralis CBS 781.70]
MKFPLFSLLLVLLAAFALATAPQKSVVISYPESTPDHVLQQAKDAIQAAGGIITHEYNLIKGFAARVPVKVLESIQTWGAEYNALIEEDQVVYTNEEVN